MFYIKTKLKKKTDSVQKNQKNMKKATSPSTMLTTNKQIVEAAVQPENVCQQPCSIL